jgi:hypothetical protein
MTEEERKARAQTLRNRTPEQQRNVQMREAEQNRRAGDNKGKREALARTAARAKSDALKPPMAPTTDRSMPTGKKVVKQMNKAAIKGIRQELKKPDTTGKNTPRYNELTRQLREMGTDKDRAKVNKIANKKPINFARLKALGKILGRGGKALGVAGFVPDIMKGGEAFSGKKKTNSSRFQG